jgi:hypothetical protein
MREAARLLYGPGLHGSRETHGIALVSSHNVCGSSALQDMLCSLRQLHACANLLASKEQEVG